MVTISCESWIRCNVGIKLWVIFQNRRDFFIAPRFCTFSICKLLFSQQLLEEFITVVVDP